MICKVEISIEIEFEYEDTVNLYRLTEAEAIEARDDYINRITGDDGKYIPNITNVWNSISPISFETFKSVATVEDYEDLFGVIVDVPEEFKNENG